MGTLLLVASVASNTVIVNPYYREWNLLTAIAALLSIGAAAVVWFLKHKPQEVERCVLKARSNLSARFQITVVDEVRRLLRLLDDRLPYVLTQRRDDSPGPSRFNSLCAQLAQLDLEDPDRDKYYYIVNDSLGGAITQAMDTFLDQVQGSLVAGSTATGIRFAFEQSTEKTLEFIATETSKVSKRLRRFRLGRRMTRWGAGLTGLCIFPAATGLFFNMRWAEWLVCTSLVVAAISAILALSSALIASNAREQLLETYGPDTEQEYAG
jgi:hypothetical protein